MAGPIPTIPLPEGETRPLPTPYETRERSPDEFGAGLGRGIVGLAEGLDKAQGRADALASQEAETAFAQEILGLVHGRTDPQTGEVRPGFTALKGHQAVEASATLSEDLGARREEIASGLANDRQRRIFLGRTQADLLGATRAIESHVEQEIVYLQKQGFDTRMEAAVKTAAAVYADPVAREEQLVNMGPWLDLAAEDRGLRGPDAERFKTAERGKVVEAVLQRLLEDEGRAADAKGWLAKHRADLTPDEAFRYGKAVEAADLRGRSRTEADRIWAEAEGDPVKALVSVRAIQDAPWADAVDQRLGRRLQDDRAVRNAADAPREGRLEVDIYQGRGLDRTSPDYQALSDEGKARVESKTFAYQRSLRAEGTAERRAQSDADRDVKAWFNGLPTPGPQGQDRLTLDVDHASELDIASPRARNEIRRLQENERKVAQRGLTPKLTEFESMVARQAQAMFPKDKAKQAKLRASMREWWTEETGEEGKPPDLATVRQKIADALLYGEEAGGVFWSNDMYRFEAERRGLEFKPFGPEKQKYPPNRQQPGDPARATTYQPPGLVPPARQAPAAKVYRRVDPATGEARVWNGSAWVPEGAR